MSKASEWAKRQPKDLTLRQIGSGHLVTVFLLIEEGVPGMRIENLGPFSVRDARKLARWILDTFGDR